MSKKIKIIADDKIPFLEKFLARHCELQLIPGHNIQNVHLRKANALLVRSITPVDEKLLQGTPVKFVGSATAGIDHIDTHWLDQNDIQWGCAPGCNAKAVAEYVLCCMAALHTRNILCHEHVRAGVIGLGKVGSFVFDLLSKLNYQVLAHDPPRANRESSFISTELNQFYNLDFICIHTPLIVDTAHPTYHLLDQKFLNNLKEGCVLLNAGRGAIIDEQILLSTPQIILCLDVWENEPLIDLALLEKVTIGTPHIAGYSFEAKERASFMVSQQLQRCFHLPVLDLPLPSSNSIQLKTDWEQLALKTYNPLTHTQQMRQRLQNSRNLAEDFESLRREYPLRREFL